MSIFNATYQQSGHQIIPIFASLQLVVQDRNQGFFYFFSFFSLDFSKNFFFQFSHIFLFLGRGGFKFETEHRSRKTFNIWQQIWFLGPYTTRFLHQKMRFRNITVLAILGLGFNIGPKPKQLFWLYTTGFTKIKVRKFDENPVQKNQGIKGSPPSVPNKVKANNPLCLKSML